MMKRGLAMQRLRLGPKATNKRPKREKGVECGEEGACEREKGCVRSRKGTPSEMAGRTKRGYLI